MDAAGSQNSFLPKPFGVTRAPDAITGDSIQATRAKISDRTRLFDLADQYVFYHPGLLYNIVPLFGRDPFTDFVAQSNYAQLTPISFKFDNLLVQGFEKMEFPEWGYFLHGLESKIFVEYLRFLGSAMFIDRNAKTLYRLRYKELKIVDPIVMQKAVTRPVVGLPRITVVTVGLDTNKGCWFYNTKLPWQLSVIKSQHVFNDTRNLAEAVLQEASHPLTDLPNFEDDNDERSSRQE
jgi:hypothetical protein